MTSMGLDIATCTGLAIVGEDEDRGRTIHFPDQKGFLRLQLIALEVVRVINAWQPGTILMEGYGHSRSIGSFVTVVEVGTVIRLALYQMGRSWYEVRPSSLKKWTTGKGNAKKDAMATAVKARWNYASGSDDIIDAFALAQMGQLPHADLIQIPGVIFQQNGRIGA